MSKKISKSYSFFKKMGYSEREEKAYAHSKSKRFLYFFGLRLGYLGWRIGLTANHFSLLRIPFVVMGFYFLTLEGVEMIFTRLFGVSLLIFQIFLDYGDGAIARARGESSPIGRQLDIFTDTVQKNIFILLLAYLSGYTIALIITPFLIYMFIKANHWNSLVGRSFLFDKSIHEYQQRYSEKHRHPQVNKLIPGILSFPITVIIIPLFCAVCNSSLFEPYFTYVCVSLFSFFSMVIMIYFKKTLFVEG